MIWRKTVPFCFFNHCQQNLSHSLYPNIHTKYTVDNMAEHFDCNVHRHKYLLLTDKLGILWRFSAFALNLLQGAVCMKGFKKCIKCFTNVSSQMQFKKYIKMMEEIFTNHACLLYFLNKHRLCT